MWIGLFWQAGRGSYEVSVDARPDGMALAGDLPFLSAEVRCDSAGASADLQLQLAEAAPNAVPAAEALARGRVLLLYLYHPRDEATMLRFDRRINAAYTDFHDAHGEHYAGVFRPLGLPGAGWLAELSSFDADTREEAEGLIPPGALTEEIEAIIKECRELQDTNRSRYAVWLTPR